MSHEIDQSNGRDNIAYIGDKPWHGLGEDMTDDADLDQWRIAAGLNHTVQEQDIMYMDETGTLHVIPDKKALVRDDTKLVLSVVGQGYNVVQPMAVIEFYRSLIEAQGFTMETAGSLMNGKRVWALARTGEEARIKGQDLLRQYILLATSYDGTMATIASATAVRVVCWNTFSYAVGENGGRADVRIPHHAIFNPEKIKAEMGLESNQWTTYIEEARVLADRKVKTKEAIEYFFALFYGDNEEVDEHSKAVERRMAQMLNVYENGVGQDTESANGTAWGLHNAVTRFVDHERKTRSDDSRLNSAWFGDGNRLKARAFYAALALVA
jgi:phage/plasmid-like protein (TIGR03299 family)